MRRLFISIFIVLAVSSCVNTEEKRKNEKEKLIDLMSDYAEDFFRLHPLAATDFGDNRYNDRFNNYLSEQFRKEKKAFFESYLAQVKSLNKDLLDETDKLNVVLLTSEIERGLEGLAYPSHLLPIDQKYSFPNLFPMLINRNPFNTAEDYTNFIKRLDVFPEMVDTAISNMEKGIRLGIVRPRIIIEKSLMNIRNQVVQDASESTFYIPFIKMNNIDPDKKEALRRDIIDKIENKLIPSYLKLIAYLEEKYLPSCRETISVSDLPDGKEWYNYTVRYHTTTDLTPDEIFETGQNEVRRIHHEIDSVKNLVGFKGSVQDFFVFLREDPRFYFKDRESIMTDYQRVRKEVEEVIPHYFKTLPEADFEIREVEAYRAATASGGSLQPATADGSRPSIFYVNTYNLKSNATYRTMDLFLHEALPGHHLQMAIQLEQEELPIFRQLAWFTAYGEGWALYAEELGQEMGLLDDPYDYYGKLNGELWRAIRLVVDVGIHHKGWTREEVIEYMMQNSSTSRAIAISETERYIIWPGQALAYKIGELKIKELRKRAETKLGDKFDIKDFHEQLLIYGNIPLSVLEEIINEWINTQMDE